MTDCEKNMKIWRRAQKNFGTFLENISMHHKMYSKFLKKNKEVLVTRVDDAVHAGSEIILIPIKGMGAHIVNIPQCTDINHHMFLYPHHIDELIYNLQKMKEIIGETDED